MKIAIVLIFACLFTNAFVNRQNLTPKYKALYDTHMKNFKNAEQPKSALFSVDDDEDDTYKLKIEQEIVTTKSKAALKTLVNLKLSGFTEQFCNSSSFTYNNLHHLVDYNTGTGPVRDANGVPVDGFGSTILGINDVVARISFLKSLAVHQKQCLCGKKAIVFAESLSKTNFGSPLYTVNDVNNRVGRWRGFLCAVIAPVIFTLTSRVYLGQMLC
jgi:hypothetical protein